jgi:protease-4
MLDDTRVLPAATSSGREEAKMPAFVPPRFFSPVLLRITFAGSVLLGSLGASRSTQAQVDPLFRYHEGSDFLPSTPGVAAGAAGAFYNPAAWATAARTEAAFWWNDESLRENSLDNWGFSVGRNLGFSVQSRTAALGPDSTARAQDYQLGYAWGDRRAHLGVAWRWSGGDDIARHAGLSLGTVIRPSRSLSLGLSGFLEDAIDPDQGTFDLGFRPFSKPWLTLFGDYSLVSGQIWDEGHWGLGTEVRPFRGIHAGVRFRDAQGADSFTYQLYAGLTLENLSFFGQPRFRDDGARAGTSYLVRLEPPYKSLPGVRVLGSGKPDRVVPIDLENRTLTYRKARWFDDKRVPWLGLAGQLETLRRDKSVRGVALNLSGFQASPVLQWELRDKLHDLQAAGKEIYVHADRLDMGGTYLASVADRLSLDPQGELFLPGLAVHRTYMRGLLDKLGVGVEEWRYFSHKTAFQTLTRKDMSEADQEQLGRLADVIYETWRDGIAAGRRLAPAEVDSVVEQAVMLTPRRAKERGLIDRIGRWPDFQDEIRKEKETKVGPLPADRNRGVLPDERWGRPPEIALVYALGPCEMEGGIHGRATGKYLRSLAKNHDVVAVVLRADSPGGDPLPSDLVAEGTRKLKEAGKPVVVSQGSVAASGGYWISMDGTRILTTPLTITGSIGVISGWIWDNGAGEKSGFTSDGVQRGSHADLFTGTRFPFVDMRLPRRNFTDSEKEETKTLMLDLYGDFVGMVASARNLPEVRVREIAEGRVWMGTDAMDRGLVDGVGTLPDAVLEAKRLAGLDDDDEILLTEYPKQAPFPRLGLLPNLPGLSLVYRALSGIPANDPKTGEETEDYGTTYFRSLGRSPAQPLLLIPPEMVPEGWDTP